MKFKKGDKVEVMDKREAPVSWRVAEIHSRDGHTYHVKYDSYPGMRDEQIGAAISRSFIRPCPPLMTGAECYAAGDIVEVFHEYSWKVAVVLEVLGGKKGNRTRMSHLQASEVHSQYLVSLISYSEELVISKSNIRMRQTWHDEKWSLMGKSSRGCNEITANRPSTSNHQKMNVQVPKFTGRTKYLPQRDCMDFPDAAVSKSPMISSRSLKRMSPYGSSIVQAHNGQGQKFRAIEKGGRRQRMNVAPLPEKVHAVAYPREFLGEKNMHASFNTIPIGYNQLEMAQINDCSQLRSSKISRSDSDACSVGSCSINSQSPNNYCLFIPLSCQDTDTLCSDAESCYGSGSERKSSSVPLKEEVEVSIHRLELHAYRSTLEALFASGPLSWEQEALITNLRIMLHISNDEHLIELKHLISAKTAINVR